MQKVKEGLLDSDSAKFKNQKGNCGEVNAKIEWVVIQDLRATSISLRMQQ